MTFRTEYEFTLPKGLIDEEGTLHREGVMRLATAADEILPQRDPRVQANPAYLTVIVLSRVVTRIGGVSSVSTTTIENLFASDLAFLQGLYNRINDVEDPTPPPDGSAPERDGRLEMASLGEV